MMIQATPDRDVNRLLEEAERLERQLRRELEQHLQMQDLQRELRGLSSELKRVVEFYQRHLRRGDRNVEQQVLQLLQSYVPQRTRSTPIYWGTLRKILRPWLPDARKQYSDEDVLFILGWTFRLLRSS